MACRFFPCVGGGHFRPGVFGLVCSVWRSVWCSDFGLDLASLASPGRCMASAPFGLQARWSGWCEVTGNGLDTEVDQDCCKVIR